MSKRRRKLGDNACNPKHIIGERVIGHCVAEPEGS